MVEFCLFSMLSALCFTLIFVLLVSSIPTWEGMPGTVSIGSLVPGASYIEALHAYNTETATTKQLILPENGRPGNLTIGPYTETPPIFFINQHHLWQLVNESTIFHVNLINQTAPFPGSAEIPVQLVVGTESAGITGGSWRWRGTMLIYDVAHNKGSGGVFYSCTLPEGEGTGVFMFLKPGPTPNNCYINTLHSFSRALQEQH